MDAGSLAVQSRPKLGGSQDTSWLKLVALFFMMIDHMDVAIFGNIPELRMLGRIALPLYAWCLVVGCTYTHDFFRYGLRLLALAVISQPINMVALGNSWAKLNILFLLFLGVVAIGGIRLRRYGSQFWAPVLCFVLLGFAQVDYGWRGLLFILMLYAARESKAGLAALFIAYAMFWGTTNNPIATILGVPLDFLSWPGLGAVLSPLFRMQAMMWMALPLILIPTHTGVRLPKWLGYGFYPLHLVLILLIRLALGDSPAMLFGVLNIP